MAKRKYTRHSTRGKLIVGKGGRLYKKNLREFYQQIESSNIDELEKIAYYEYLEAMVLRKRTKKEKMSTNGFLAIFEENKMAKLCRNAGRSVTDVAQELGISEDELLHNVKWVDSHTIMLNDGREFTFEFNYTTDLFTEIHRR